MVDVQNPAQPKLVSPLPHKTIYHNASGGAGS